MVVHVDERVRAGESPALYVRRLAAEKSAAGAAAKHGPAKAGHYRDQTQRPAEAGHDRDQTQRPAQPGHSRKDRPTETISVVSGFSRTDIVILAADTAVVVDGEVLGKPRDDVDAGRMLRRLSGRQHEVLTGISLRRSACEVGCVVATIVEFATLSDGDISWYLASGEGRDKAGAYAIQGLASRFILRIDGSYSNVVGLPVAAVHELIGQLKSA